eukprot:1560083-Prymnesium_polylepis.1
MCVYGDQTCPVTWGPPGAAAAVCVQAERDAKSRPTFIMPSSTTGKVDGMSTTKAKRPGLLGCCCGSIEEVAME